MIEDRYKYDSVLMGKYIIAYANANKYVINMTKLQKLLYVFYGTYLAVTNERLVDERPHAWPFGPVFPRVRKAFLKRDDDFSDITFDDPELKEIQQDEFIKKYSPIIFNTFGKHTAGALIRWTHVEGGPWDVETKRDDFKWNDTMDDYKIQEFFNKILV